MLEWLVVIAIAVLLLRVILRYNVVACTSKESMSGKVIIVTGANSGIGYETAKALAKRGARVVLACRCESRGTRAADQIIQETGNDDVVYKRLDLASLTSVRKFCEDVKATERRLDVLVNNAGVYGLGDRRSEDGIIEAMQVNLFGPMLLTDLLLPLLRQSRGRVVNVSSLLHYLGELSVRKVDTAGNYGDFMKYCNSKFGNVVFTAELARRLRESGVCVVACHPGVVYTTITSRKRLVEVFFSVLCWVCKRSAAEAAATSVHLCGCDVTSGGFYVDCAMWPLWNCGNPTAAQDLWAVAEKLMKCTLENTKC